MANSSDNVDEDVDFYTGIGSRSPAENELHLLQRKKAKGKYNDLQVRFNEMAENLDYTQMLFTDNRDYEEIKLRNKKLENDLIHSNEKYLNELSMVRENFENQMKSRTSLLQGEIDELRLRKEQIYLEHNQQINELQDVVETERSLQQNRFQDIIRHFESILNRTVLFNQQLQKDFDSLKEVTNSLKAQTYDLEYDLNREFADNLNILRRTLPFVIRQESKDDDFADDIPASHYEPDPDPSSMKLVFGNDCNKNRNL